MAIARSGLGSAKFGNLVTGRRLAPVHPGDVLLHDFIDAMGLSRYRVAKSIGVPQRRIDEICAGKRAMTADTALRLGRYFEVEPQFWMNLQSQFDLEVAERAMQPGAIAAIEPVKKAA